MPKYRPYITDDGSIGLFSGDYDDIFHSRYGALTEAYEKFILPVNIEKYFNKPELNILDICYGIGYNTKAFINYLTKEIVNIINNVSIHSDKLLQEEKGKNIETIATDKNLENFFNKLNSNSISQDCKSGENICSANVLLENSQKYDCENNIINNIIQNIPQININALEFEQEFVDISPLIKEICYSEKYKILPEVNDFIYRQLINQYGNDYISRIKTYVSDSSGMNGILKTHFKFFNTNMLKSALDGQRKGYNYTPNRLLNLLLHNIYYQHISKRPANKNMFIYTNFYQNISKRVLNKITIKFFTDDARISIKNMSKKFDLIFLDAFTPSKLPTLWTVEFFKELYKIMSYNGVLLTYTNSARVRNAMLEAGFYIGNIKSKDNHLLGTIATKNSENVDYPLTNKELGLLNTKAGIPYRDINLSLSKDEILELLDNDVKNSTKISSSQYLKGVNNEI